MFYCICYDIKDDRRRIRVAKALADFGERVQLGLSRTWGVHPLEITCAAFVEYWSTGVLE
jgi:CRISPR/Cas system endoribonuclease Cas6 (RAMP superfamily)